MTAVIHPKLASFIATRDRRAAKCSDLGDDQLSNLFAQLLARGSVNVGGRASCGGAADPTWLIRSMWLEIVKKARSLGYEISATSIPQKNAWATKAGGFWNEDEYRTVKDPLTVGVVGTGATAEESSVVHSDQLIGAVTP